MLDRNLIFTSLGFGYAIWMTSSFRFECDRECPMKPNPYWTDVWGWTAWGGTTHMKCRPLDLGDPSCRAVPGGSLTNSESLNQSPLRKSATAIVWQHEIASWYCRCPMKHNLCWTDIRWWTASRGATHMKCRPLDLGGPSCRADPCE